MKVFISWSGERSKALAHALRKWLPDLIHSVEPWMSEKDLEVGKQWIRQLSEELANSKFAILCLTKENARSSWMAFEAGASVNHLIDQTRVCPILLDMQPSELLSGPFGQFQAVGVDKDGMLRLAHAINRASVDRMVEADRIDRAFEKWWPELSISLAEIHQLKSSLLFRDESEPLHLVESFHDSLRIATQMIESADHRFLVLRHYGGGSTVDEDEYFKATKSRLLSRRLPVYRRLVNIQTKKNVQQVEWVLENLGTLGPLEIKVWSEPEFPTNCELMIGDNKAMIAFSPEINGVPNRGITVSDEKLAANLIGLFYLYWNDIRAMTVKPSIVMNGKEVQEAMSRVWAIHDSFSVGTRVSKQND